MSKGTNVGTSKVTNDFRDIRGHCAPFAEKGDWLLSERDFEVIFHFSFGMNVRNKAMMLFDAECKGKA